MGEITGRQKSHEYDTYRAYNVYFWV